MQCNAQWNPVLYINGFGVFPSGLFVSQIRASVLSKTEHPHRRFAGMCLKVCSQFIWLLFFGCVFWIPPREMYQITNISKVSSLHTDRHQRTVQSCLCVCVFCCVIWVFLFVFSVYWGTGSIMCSRWGVMGRPTTNSVDFLIQSMNLYLFVQMFLCVPVLRLPGSVGWRRSLYRRFGLPRYVNQPCLLTINPNSAFPWWSIPPLSHIMRTQWNERWLPCGFSGILSTSIPTQKPTISHKNFQAYSGWTPSPKIGSSADPKT